MEKWSDCPVGGRGAALHVQGNLFAAHFWVKAQHVFPMYSKVNVLMNFGKHSLKVYVVKITHNVKKAIGVSNLQVDYFPIEFVRGVISFMSAFDHKRQAVCGSKHHI